MPNYCNNCLHWTAPADLDKADIIILDNNGKPAPHREGYAVCMSEKRYYARHVIARGDQVEFTPEKYTCMYHEKKSLL